MGPSQILEGCCLAQFPKGQALGEVRSPYKAFLIFQTTPGETTSVSTRLLGGLMKISLPPISVSLSLKRRAYRNAVEISHHSIGHPMCDAAESAIRRDG